MIQPINTDTDDLLNISSPLLISFENNFQSSQNSIFFKKTLDDNKWSYIFIGEGVVWEGFKTRVYNYYNYIQRLPDEKIVILSDARDVFCTRSPSAFIDAFHAKQIDLNNKIVVSAELFLKGHMDWSDEQLATVITREPFYFFQGIPLKEYWSHHKINPLPLRKYVNAGLMVGKVKNLKHLLGWIIANNYNDDQLGVSCYTNQFPENIYVDYNAEIVHTSTFGVCGGFYSTKQNIDSPTIAELMGMSSFFLHIPGLSGSKGQKYMYDLLKKTYNSMLFNKEEILKLYGIPLTNAYEYEFISNER